MIEIYFCFKNQFTEQRQRFITVKVLNCIGAYTVNPTMLDKYFFSVKGAEGRLKVTTFLLNSSTVNMFAKYCGMWLILLTLPEAEVQRVLVKLCKC